jgi:hypothetical protein
MQITLFPYERQVLETLEQTFELERELVVDFALSLNDLVRLFKEVACRSEMQFREGCVVLLGLVNHTHHLLNGGMQALHVGNGPVWSCCVRGLMEIYGACVLISERPRTAPNYLKHVAAGKLRAAAERGHPGLKDDIYRLDQIVHPAAGAIYAGFQPVDTEAYFVHARFGLRAPTLDEGREGATVLANIASLIVEKLKELAGHSDVLTQGKLIMVLAEDTRN